MADLAELGFKVDTGGLKNATSDLDRMSSAAGRAEKSTFGLTNAKRDLKRAAMASTAAAIGFAAAVAKLTSNGLASVDAQAKLARSLQGTADGLRAVQLAASEAGVEGMDASLAKLNRRLGAAQMGVGEFAKTTEALGLNLKELQGMDVDRRIAAIADAVKSAGLSSQETARHLQQLGFTQAQANDFFRQGGDAIREARTAVDAYGLSMSAVDSAQVEAANDAWSRTSLVIEGVQNKLAVEFAPILQFVSELINDAATEGEGFGPAIEKGFEKGVRAAAFLVDAVEGVRRVFVLAGQGIATFALVSMKHLMQVTEFILAGPTHAVNGLIMQMNRLPGVSIELLQPMNVVKQLQAEISLAEGAVKEGVSAMKATLSAPMPSVGLLEALDRSKDASRAAAEQITDDREREREAFAEMAWSAQDAADASDDFAASLEDQSMASAAAAQAARNFAREFDTLRRRLDPTWAKTQDYLEAVETLDEAWVAGLISGEQYDELMLRLATGAEDAAGKTRELASEADPLADIWLNAVNRVDQAFSDLFVSAFQGFEDFRRSLTASFQRLLGELAYAAAKQRIMIGVGIATGGIGTAQAAGSAAQAAGSDGGMLGGGFNPTSLFTGNSLGMGIENMGAHFLGEGGSSFLAGAGNYANWMYGGAAALGGLAGQQFGGHGGIGGSLGATVGMALGGPLGAALGALAGGALGGILGGGHSWQTTGAGVELGWDEGFTGLAYEGQKKKRAFRGNKSRRRYSDLDADVEDAIDDALMGAFDAIERGAKTFGLETVADLETFFVEATRLELSKKSEEEIDAIIGEWVAGTADAYARHILASTDDIEDLALEGEGVTETLTRLVTSFEFVSASADALNLQFDGVGLQAGDAAHQLIGLAGGIEGLSQMQASYYQQFYSDQEKLGDAFTDLSAVFESIGEDVPATSAEFRGLVESLDLMTDEGRKAYVTLLQVAPAFGEIRKAVEDVLGISADAISSMIWDVLSTASSEAEARRMAEERAIGMLYEGLTNSLLNSVSSIILDGVVGQMMPLLAAGAAESAATQAAGGAAAASSMAAGGSAAASTVAAGGSAGGSAVAQGGAIAGNALANIVDQAVSTINVMRKVLNDPAFQEALGEIGVAVGSVTGAMFGAGFRPGGTFGGGFGSTGRVSTGGGPVSDGGGPVSDGGDDDPLPELLERLRGEIDALQLSLSELDMTAYERELAKIQRGTDEWAQSLVDAGMTAESAAESVAEWTAAQKELLDAQNKARADEIMSGVNDALASLWLSDYEREILRISEQTEDYIDQLNDLGQATQENIAAIEELADAQRAQAAVNKAFGELEKSVQAAREDAQKSAREQIDAIREESESRIEANRLARDAAREGLRDITREARQIERARRRLAGEYEPTQESVRARALDTLRSGITTGEFEGMGDAAEIASEIADRDYTSSSEFRAEQARTLYLLAMADKKAGEQVDHAERAVKRIEQTIDAIRETSREQIEHLQIGLEAELERLDAIVLDGERQIDALHGIDNSVMSVQEAIDRMSAAVRAAAQDSDSGGTTAVPGYANGGTHLGGLRIVGERGPELEATGPARYLNHNQLMSGLRGGGSVESLRQDMMAGLRAIEKNTREIKQIEQRWERLGLPEQREFV